MVYFIFRLFPYILTLLSIVEDSAIFCRNSILELPVHMYDLRTTFHMSSFNGYLVTAITYKIKEDFRAVNKTIFHILQKYYFNLLYIFKIVSPCMYLHPDLSGKLSRPQCHCD